MGEIYNANILPKKLRQAYRGIDAFHDYMLNTWVHDTDAKFDSYV